jgi:long-chain acyl-CoA synthetase
MKPTRLFDLLPQQLSQFPANDALAYKYNGEWKRFSTQEFVDIVNRMSIGLRKEGIKKGDKVAIISPNRPEWNFADFALQQLGAVSVPMYPTITERDYRYIFEDAGVKMVFVSDSELLQKVKNATKGLPIQGIYTFDEVEGADHWKKLEKAGEGEEVSQLESFKKEVQPTDLLTLIYTSGTTGNPKGVMLTHNNIMSNALAVADLFPETETNGRILSFLPICHIFERTAIYSYINKGRSIYYAQSMETIGEDLKEVKPDMFTTVPRLLEKVYDKIVAKGMELKGLKKNLFFWALRLGNQYEPHKKNSWWYNTQLKLANKIIFNKWREALGGNVKMIVSGAAALQPRLGRVFWAAQIPVCEAYGLTETSPGIAFNRLDPARVRVGTVGELLDGVQVKISADGEILVKGPNVMQGYYNKPELTDEVIDKDGWFHTGDVGELLEGRFLRITDRKKEMFKTSGGKYVAPQLLENKIKESTLIEQVMVVGEGQRFPGALVVPNFDTLKEWCKIKEIEYTNNAAMLRHPQVKEKFEREIGKSNQDFAQYEKVKQFRLLHQPWSIETGELTPTLKLKRKAIMQKNEALVQEIYAEDYPTKPSVQGESAVV